MSGDDVDVLAGGDWVFLPVFSAAVDGTAAFLAGTLFSCFFVASPRCGLAVAVVVAPGVVLDAAAGVVEVGASPCRVVRSWPSALSATTRLLVRTRGRVFDGAWEWRGEGAAAGARGTRRADVCGLLAVFGAADVLEPRVDVPGRWRLPDACGVRGFAHAVESGARAFDGEPVIGCKVRRDMRVTVVDVTGGWEGVPTSAAAMRETGFVLLHRKEPVPTRWKKEAVTRKQGQSTLSPLCSCRCGQK